MGPFVRKGRQRGEGIHAMTGGFLQNGAEPNSNSMHDQCATSFTLIVCHMAWAESHAGPGRQMI